MGWAGVPGSAGWAWEPRAPRPGLCLASLSTSGFPSGPLRAGDGPMCSTWPQGSHGTFRDAGKQGASPCASFLSLVFLMGVSSKDVVCL